MQCLSDRALTDAYKEAMKMNLDDDFIKLLTDELRRRDIFIL